MKSQELSWKRKGASAIFGGGPTARKGDEYGVGYRLSFIKNLRSSGLTLDVGCGFGAYISSITNSLGLEIEDRFFAISKAEIVKGVGEAIPIRTGSCGRVFLFEVIEHVKDEALVLKEIRRVISHDGYLFLTAPNRFFPFETHGLDLFGKSIENLMGIGIPLFSLFPRSIRNHWERARIYSQKDLVTLLHKNGFKTAKIGYMPPPLDGVRQSHLVTSIRSIFESISKYSPFRQMGVACLVVAAPI